jgi:hypothetical protein
VTKICIYGHVFEGPYEICDPCIARRRAECESRRQQPNYKPSNPACSYGWHQLVLTCEPCQRDGSWGNKGCGPCEKCHYCNEVHPELAAA